MTFHLQPPSARAEALLPAVTARLEESRSRRAYELLHTSLVVHDDAEPGLRRLAATWLEAAAPSW